MGLITNVLVSLCVALPMSVGVQAITETPPDEAVAEFFDALSAGESTAIVEYIENKELSSELLRGFSYEIKDFREKGDVAVVSATVTNKDFSQVMADYEKKSYDYIMDNLYDSAVEDKETLSEQCFNIYMDVVKKKASGGDETSTDIYVPLIRNSSGQWEVRLDKEIATDLLGNLKLPSKEKAADAASDLREYNLKEELRLTAVGNVLEQEEIPKYSYEEVSNMDVSKPSGVTVADLKLVTKKNLVGLEEAFYKAEQDYGINALFVLAIASHESAYGTHCFRPNNLFGFGRKGYASKEECIDVVAKCLATKYLKPGASLYSGNTIDSVNKRYAADPAWDAKVAKKMVSFYEIISENHNRNLQKLR